MFDEPIMSEEKRKIVSEEAQKRAAHVISKAIIKGNINSDLFISALVDMYFMGVKDKQKEIREVIGFDT